MILLSSAVVLTAAELKYIFGYLRSYFKAGLKKADVKTVLSQKKKNFKITSFLAWIQRHVCNVKDWFSVSKIKYKASDITVLIIKHILLNSFYCFEFCFKLRGGPLENLSGRGGGRITKKLFAQGKIKGKKIHARQLTLRNIHATA